LATSETAKKELIEDLQNNISYSFNGWSPSVNVWRAGEGYERKLPYIAVDFIQTSDKRFASFADIVGRIDDMRFEYAYCEIELVNITIYTNKYHNSKAVIGREYASEILTRIRSRILAYWSDTILYRYKASVGRGQPAPIRDLTLYDVETGTRIHEFDLTVFLRTDVRWYKTLPQGVEAQQRAEKAYIVMQNKNNIRIDTS